MPGEKDLHPYQKFCVDFLEEKPQCALFLDCGLGKTVITLTAISHLLYDSYEVSRVLIIAPLRVARDTWIGELSKWEHLKGLRMERILGTPRERVAALSRKAELYVINRENVEWLVKHYAGRKLPFDMLVIDELSSFKNSRAKRFLALKKVLGQFSRVVGLTGTPAPNGLEDLWPQVFLLDRGQRLGRTMRSYLDLYFTTPNSWLPYKHELKPGAEEQIYQRLSDLCVSMRAADHLQMPERIDNIEELTLSPREEKLYRQMERDMLLPYADGDVLALNAATLAGKLLQKKELPFLDSRLHLIAVADGEEKTILGRKTTFFDIGSTKAKQYGFCMELGSGEKLTCCGDEPYNECEKQYAEHSTWLLHEAFCLHGQADIFHPYEKHHSTVKDAAELAESLGVKNLLLYHTEDRNIARRKELYTAEGRQYFHGNLFVPEDLEVIEL